MFQGRLHACMYVSEKILEMFVLWEEISRDRLDQNQPDLRSAICKSNQEAASPPQRFQGWRIWFGSYQAFAMIPTFLEEVSHVMVSILKEKTSGLCHDSHIPRGGGPDDGFNKLEITEEKLLKKNLTFTLQFSCRQ